MRRKVAPAIDASPIFPASRLWPINSTIAHPSYPFTIESEGGLHIIRLEALFDALVKAVRLRTSPSEISASFHGTAALMVAQMCELVGKETSLRTVALSGGCFQNRQLLRLVADAVGNRGFHVLLHRQVPCNDGGLSLGQAVTAHFLQGGK